MDRSVNDFSFQQFSATSTPMPTSACQYLKKRPLLKEKNNLVSASPASKKVPMSADESSSNETMPDLFFFDKKSPDGFSFEEEGQENQLKKVLSSVSEVTSFSNSSREENSHSPLHMDKGHQQYKPKLIICSDVEDSIVSSSSTKNEKGEAKQSQDSIREDESGTSEKEPQVEHESNATSSGALPGEHIETVSDSQSEVESVLIEEDEGSDGDGVMLLPNRKEGEKNHSGEAPAAIFMPQPTMALNSNRDEKHNAMPVQPGRLFGGKMTDERFQKISSVSDDVISAMHSSLSTLPENVPTDSPNGLRVDLLSHQKTGLTWLLWREQQMPPSGILADDMGLGKTLAMISLILHKKNERIANSDAMLRMDKKLRRQYIEGAFLTPANSTLVVAPASLIFQWEKEVRDRVKSDLKVHIFHGPKQKRDISVERLIKYDLVITTYDTLASELKNQRTNLIGADDDTGENSAGIFRGKRMSRKFLRAPSSVLAKIAWERIILDEAHEIRNKNSLKFNCCCGLEAVHRWCLTGTPIHNKLWDLFSLIRFLRVSPFSEEKMWKEFIMTSSATSAQRLNVIVKSILLRRTKNQICVETNRPIVDLQPKKYELVNLELQKLEKHCYSILFEASKQKVRELIQDGAFGGYGTLRRFKPGAKIKNPFVGGGAQMSVDANFKAYSCILSLLLRLRQACVHLSLLRKAIDIDAFKEDEADGDNEAENLVAKALETSMAQMSLDEDGLDDTEERANDNGQQIEGLFQKEHRSTKVNALLNRLSGIVQNDDKCVIVSQWTSMLAIIEFHLRQRNISFTSITGEVRTEERQSRVDAFNRANAGPKVMLLSLTAGGVGLNLTGGNHLFLVDLHWNPALELQASDRIHRLGQTKNVFVHKFVCASTIEQRVLQLQEKKKAMASSVLEGAAKKLGKLTRDDVMYLFELEKRPNNKQKTGQSQKPTTSSQM